MSPRYTNLDAIEPAFMHVIETTDRLCTSSLPVLIRGGDRRTRRSLARDVHERGSRCHEPFVTVDCTEPEDLLLSRLFGRDRSMGAEMLGAFELARAGTVVLDEVDRMPRSVQAALSLAINQKLLTRVGSCESTPMTARIVACAGRDLEGLAAQGAFRQMLLLRLSPLTLRVGRRVDGGALLDSVRGFLQRQSFSIQRQVRRLEAVSP